MLFSVQWLSIVLPLLLVQYILAIFTLTRLALARLPIKIYVVWNLVILFVVFIGSIVFLIYYYCHRRKIGQAIIAEEDARAATAEKAKEPEKAQEEEQKQDTP